MIEFPIEVTIQIYDDTWDEGLVYDFVDLYRALETRRLYVAVERGREQAALVSIYINNGAAPVMFVLSNVQRSVFENGYGIAALTRLVTDAVETQQMFQHLSTEPHSYTTTWEDLV